MMAPRCVRSRVRREFFQIIGGEAARSASRAGRQSDFPGVDSALSIGVASCQVFYSGRVQGVGFRYSVKRLATGYDVVGWVRNLPDGRVELRVDGEPGEVAAFLEAIAASPLRHHVQGIERHPLPPMSGCSGFVIEH